jgi:hypothetical protein
VLALILLFEEWGWRPLVAALAWLSRFGPWARLELFIASLPPYAALALLALPTSLLFPLKLLSVYLLASGQVFAAGALFFGVKVASTALIARLFLLTRPALMRIGWFAAAYDWLMPWKDALFAEIRASWAWRYGRMIKTRARHETVQAWTRARPSRSRPGTRSATVRAKPGRVSSPPSSTRPAASASRCCVCWDARDGLLRARHLRTARDGARRSPEARNRMISSRSSGTLSTWKSVLKAPTCTGL